MSKDDPDAELRKENKQLRQALDGCRELLKRTEQLLKKAPRSRGAKEQSSD